MRRLDPIFTDMMSEINDFGLEVTFGRLQFEAMFKEAFKDHSHPFQMLFWVLRQHDLIIQIDETIGQI